MPKSLVSYVDDLDEKGKSHLKLFFKEWSIAVPLSAENTHGRIVLGFYQEHSVSWNPSWCCSRGTNKETKNDNQWLRNPLSHECRLSCTPLY